MDLCVFIVALHCWAAMHDLLLTVAAARVPSGQRDGTAVAASNRPLRDRGVDRRDVHFEDRRRGRAGRSGSFPRFQRLEGRWGDGDVSGNNARGEARIPRETETANRLEKEKFSL